MKAAKVQDAQRAASPSEIQAGGDKLVRASQFVRETVARFYEVQRKSKGEKPVVDLKFTTDSHHKYVVTITIGDWYGTTYLPGDWVDRESTEDVIEAMLNEAYAKIRSEEFAKSTDPNYPIEIVRNTEGDLNTEAAKLGYTFEGALATLRWAKEVARETTRRAKAEPHPHWIVAHTTGETVPDFIKRVFAAELADGSMHKGLLSRYENLRRDFYAYQRHHELPGWLKAVPTQEDWNTQQIEAGRAKPTSAPRPRTEEQRLYDVVTQRRARGRRRDLP